MNKIWADFQVALFSGIIAGLLSAFIVFMFGNFWIKVIQPWIENFVYKGPRIDGSWKAEVKVGNEERKQLVVIKQQAYKVKGTISYPEDTQKCSHTYKFEGCFENNILTALATEIGRARFDRGSLTLVLQAGYGETVMKGVGVWQEGRDTITIEYRLTFEN